MSDTQSAPDWWLASDGKWYPPAQVSGPPIPPPTYETSTQAKLRKGQEKLRSQAQPFLEPGEQLQGVFVSQTGPSPGHLGLASNLQRYRIVAVTDRNILVCPFGVKGQAARISRVPFELPETVGKSWFPVTIGGTRHWVASTQFEIVTAANEYLRAEQSMSATGPAPEPTAAAPGQLSAAAVADWYPDPMGRHQMRYWDGRTWTALVADQGGQSNDPI